MNQLSKGSAVLATRFPDAPERIKRLPVESRGFPVPWFLSWYGEGEPDFRFVHPLRVVEATRHRLCWICGEKLGRMKAFTIGPMCAVNLTSSEPPSHPECARFAATACPFLSRPLAKRGQIEAELEPHLSTPGIMLDRNPGVCLVWQTLRFKPFRSQHGGEGLLFDIGKPEHVEWYSEGRAATCEEVVESVRTGMPFLSNLAEQEGPDAVALLVTRVAAAMKLFPKPTTNQQGEPVICQPRQHDLSSRHP